MKTPFALIRSLGCLLFLLSLPGCGTLQPNTARQLATTVKVAAYVGTAEALRQHPEWRAGFDQAAADLELLETADQLDAATLLAIVQRLPVKELKSERAVLLITSATLLLQEFGADAVPIDQVKELKPIAKALREGIELGLQ